MAENSFIDEIGVAAEIRARISGQLRADRHRLRRTVVATGVLAVHVLIILWMVSTKLVPMAKLEPPHKTQMIWLLAPRKAPSGVNRPADQSEIVDQVYKAVQLMDKVPQADRPNAITQDPGLALGQALACGAGQFEYLTKEGQARCRTRPWDFTYDRHGYIILREPRMPVRREAKKMLPHEKELHDRMYATPNCADGAANNGPCLGGLTPH